MRCGETCRKYLLISGGLEPIPVDKKSKKKGRSGLGE
jgi:hypothetical protein